MRMHMHGVHVSTSPSVASSPRSLASKRPLPGWNVSEHHAEKSCTHTHHAPGHAHERMHVCTHARGAWSSASLASYPPLELHERVGALASGPILDRRHHRRAEVGKLLVEDLHDAHRLGDELPVQLDDRQEAALHLVEEPLRLVAV